MKLRTDLKLDDVGVERAFPVIEQLPRDDPLAGIAAALQEFDRHDFACLRVFCQLDEAGSSSACDTAIVLVSINIPGFAVHEAQQPSAASTASAVLASFQ